MYIELLFFRKILFTTFDGTNSCTEKSRVVAAEFSIEFVRFIIQLNHRFYVRPALFLPFLNAARQVSKPFEMAT